jgi:hypothetical protein
MAKKGLTWIWRVRMVDRLLFERDVSEVGSLRERARRAIADIGGGPPIATQIAFVRKLVEDPYEARQFTNDPKTYLVEHRMVLDPDVIGLLISASLVDVGINYSLMNNIGDAATEDILAIRAFIQQPGGTQANVVAAAAVVAAAVAVATLVVTLVRANMEYERLILTRPDYVLMPGGEEIRFSEEALRGEFLRRP